MEIIIVMGSLMRCESCGDGVPLNLCGACSSILNTDKRNLVAKREVYQAVSAENRQLQKAIEIQYSKTADIRRKMAQRDRLQQIAAEQQQFTNDSMEVTSNEGEYLNSLLSAIEAKQKNIENTRILLRKYRHENQRNRENTLRLEPEETHHLQELQQMRKKKIECLLKTIPLCYHKEIDKVQILESYVAASGNYAETLNDVEGQQKLANAFGVLCMVLETASLCLQVPLLYQVIPRASQSVIVDDGVEYPLFGSMTKEFQRALECLNTNIIHLIHLQGFQTGHPNKAITYFVHLIHQPTLGQEPPFLYNRALLTTQEPTTPFEKPDAMNDFVYINSQ